MILLFRKSIQNTDGSVMCVSMLIGTILSIGVIDALFARSGKVLALKQEFMMSVRGSTRKLPAVLISFGSI